MDFDTLYPASGTPLVTPANHPVHPVSIAFKERFHSAVGKVSHPSGQTFLNRRIPSVGSEKHALDSPTDQYTHTLSVHAPLIELTMHRSNHNGQRQHGNS
jgi:hypothetical protein